MKKLCWLMMFCVVVSLTLTIDASKDKERSAISKKQVIIKKEKAVDIALKAVPIPQGYRLALCRLGKAYIGDETVWIVWYEPIDRQKVLNIFGYVEGIGVEIDPQTGEVICFERSELASINAPVRLTPEQAIEKAKEFLTPWIQQYTSWENLQLLEKPYLRVYDWHTKGKKMWKSWYEVKFARIVDGWPWGVNGWRVHIDAFSSEILFYYQRWNKERVWVDDRNLMPKEKAIELVAKEIKNRGLRVHLTGEVSVRTYGFGEKQPDGSLRIPLIYIVHYDLEVPRHLEEYFKKRYGRPVWPGGCKIDPYTGKFIDPPEDLRDHFINFRE